MLWTLAGLLATAPSLAAEPVAAQAEMMQNVKHVSPMPTYMMVIRTHEAELSLTAEQDQALADWQSKHQGPFRQAVQEVVQLETELKKMSHDGATKEALMAKLDQVLEKRRSAAETKIDCRDNTKSILTDAQWAQVIDWAQG